jgi:hypothetical protein
MEFQDKVTMSISNWSEYQNDDSIEFAFGKVDFLSNRPNSHKHLYSEEVIKENAPTVLGKWVVAEFNKYTSDATTHTDNEVIVGYVPTSQEVKYRYDADGYLVASVDVIISKIYATDVYEMFKRKNYKSVSIEELVNFTEETSNIIDGVEEKVIESFNICGITILGDNYNPSVPNANIQLTKMSESDVDLEDIYVTYSEKHMDKIDIVLSKLESIERKLNKEENMENQLNPSEEQVVQNSCAEENACENKEVINSEVVENEAVDNAEVVDNEAVENACGNEKEVDNACGEEEVKNEEVEKPKDEEEDIESKDEDKEDDDKSTVENVEMAELQTKLTEAEAKIASYESEIAELKSFKESVQNAEKKEIGNQTLEKIKSFISAEEYSDYQKQFEECQYSEVGALKNSILAKYVDSIIEMSQNNEKTEVVDYGLPVENNKVDSIYD